ncbi:MAG: riboflavin synthase [Acidimicrobiia bacterium]
MFTGIVEELGHIVAIDHVEGGARITIAAKTVLEDVTLGASIAVNGVCLTVVDYTDAEWSTDAQIETMNRTALGDLVPGAPVNLERPVRLADRLGGHLVQGHVDGVAELSGRADLPDGSRRLTLTPPRSLMRYIVEKGSVTLNGVSLTVASHTAESLDVACIPHTLAVTTLGTAEIGAHMNIEVDVFARYVERLMEERG